MDKNYMSVIPMRRFGFLALASCLVLFLAGIPLLPVSGMFVLGFWVCIALQIACAGLSAIFSVKIVAEPRYEKVKDDYALQKPVIQVVPVEKIGSNIPVWLISLFFIGVFTIVAPPKDGAMTLGFWAALPVFTIFLVIGMQLTAIIVSKGKREKDTKSLLNASAESGDEGSEWPDLEQEYLRDETLSS